MKKVKISNVVMLGSLLFFFTFSPVFAASILLTSASNSSLKELSVTVNLEAEGDSFNAYGGQIDYDRRYLYLKKIDTSDSIVSSWVTYPEKDNSTTGDDSIFFEGLSQGGFSGVLIPDVQKKLPGKLFTLIFSVEKEGNADITISNVHIYKDDGNATEVMTTDKSITLDLPVAYVKNNHLLADYGVVRQENSENQNIFLMKATTSEIYGGKEFIIFDNLNKQKSPKDFEVSESSSQNPRDIPDFSWTKAKSPYLLTQPGSNNYIHVRVNYIDGTYSYQTLRTVENKTKYGALSYILLLVSLLVLTLSYAVSFIFKKE